MGIIRKNLIGIEICADNIKMVKMTAKGKITNSAFANLPENIIQNGRIESKQMLTETIRLARKKLNISFHDCVLCLDSTDVIIRQILIPQMEEEYLRKNISLELADFLPISTDRYVIDYVITDTIPEEPRKYQILVFAAPADTVHMYAACIRAAGFRLRYIDIMENAYGKLHGVLRESGVTQSTNFACLYMDYTRTSVCVFGKGRFFINKSIDNNMQKIIREIAEKTGQPPEIVRNQIYNNTILDGDDTFTIERSVIERNFKDISYDAVRVLDYYKSKNPDAPVETIYLSGSVTHLKGISHYLQNLTGLPIHIMPDYLDTLFKDVPGRNNGVDYTNAIAVTLREEN